MASILPLTILFFQTLGLGSLWNIYYNEHQLTPSVIELESYLLT